MKEVFSLYASLQCPFAILNTSMGDAIDRLITANVENNPNVEPEVMCLIIMVENVNVSIHKHPRMVPSFMAFSLWLICTVSVVIFGKDT